MPKSRPLIPLSYDDHSAEVSGAQADLAIHAGPGAVKRIIVTAAGTAPSVVEVYDGPVATGVRVGRANGVANADGELQVVEVNAWCTNSIHVKSTDGGANLRFVITGDFR